MTKKRRIPAKKKMASKVRKTPSAAREQFPNGATHVRRTEEFPIVAIGASAGGLEALELFLKNVPKENSSAYVVIQHLDPTHKGIMVELLQRATPMKVLQTEDRTPVQPNCVYVIPPNKDMSILHGVLYLLDPMAPRGLRLPIDFFFRSLADDRREQSYAVILSGMGTDGTLGLKAIKEHDGAVFVQAPDSAKFDGMPRSAIATGMADVVAAAEELPGKILAYMRHSPQAGRSGLEADDKTVSALQKVVILLRAKTGHDFSDYKKSTIYRRIERRMAIHQIEKIGDYVRFLQENSQELDLLFNELLIGVTSFFRDPEMWDHLRKTIIPSLLGDRKRNPALRAWVAGCSTGEEAYSLAMVFKEVVDELKPSGKFSLQVFATDLDRNAIEKARSGQFPANIAADVSHDRLNRHFVQTEHGYQVAKPIREMVVFAPQSITKDPPFTKLDIMCCRNLLIYLTQEAQQRLIPLFHYSLNARGILLLGGAETVGTFTELFTAIDRKTRIYRKIDSRVQRNAMEFPSSFTTLMGNQHSAELKKPVANIQVLADQLLLRQFSPAVALVNDRGDILYTSGRTGKYFEPAAGKANWNVFAMAREGLSFELNRTFQEALKTKKEQNVSNLRVGTNGGTQSAKLTILPLQHPEALRGLVMIVVSEAPTLPNSKAPRERDRGLPKNARTRELQLELEQDRQELRNIREEMQTSQEELKSANEELQSANEELQSTNEELTTSKEEMQSMNEELQTINHELQEKVDELSHANNDIKNLLESTNIATLFLDNSLRIRRFTNRIAEITNLIHVDIGRPLTDIASDLFYPDLTNDAQNVLRTLVSVEKQVVTTNGHWYATRILPYRTLENVIAGVVITFTDITKLKMYEEQYRLARVGLENQVAQQAKEIEKSAEELRQERLRTEGDHDGNDRPEDTVDVS